MGNPFGSSKPEEPRKSVRQTKRLSHPKISRIDTEKNNTHGWYVRIRENGKVRSKFFSDRKYGGKANALNKARHYRNREVKEVFENAHSVRPEKAPQRVIVTKNKHNNTGVIGVQRIERENAGGSIYQAFRVAYVDRNGKAKTKFFSIKKLGEEAAFRLACEFRIQKLLE